MDCKATVKMGDSSRGGRTRGDNQALDHDRGCQEQYTPFGVVNEDTGKPHLESVRNFVCEPGERISHWE